MRRTAVIAVLFGVCSGLFACTERLLLPGGLAGGGINGGMAGGGVGGAGGAAANSDGGAPAMAGSSGAGGFLAGGGRNGQGNGGGTNGSTCLGDTVDLRFNIKKAKVLLSLSRSSSMTTPFGDGTRIGYAQQIVRNEVFNSDNAVSFGYQDFPSPVACFDGSSCCANPDPVDIAASAYTAINQALKQCESTAPASGCFARMDRPIVDALRDAQGILGSDGSFDRYLVLIVDGPPGCANSDADRACSDAQKQVSALSLDEIKTYVVTIGEEAEQNPCLQKLGELESMNPPFVHPGRDPHQLSQSIHQIVSRAAADACILNLSSASPPGSRVLLRLKGKDVPYDPNGQNGWSFVSQGSRDQIVVRGASCTELQDTSFADITLKRCLP